MTVEGKVARAENDKPPACVVAFLPAAMEVEADAFAELCFESWLSLRNVATWLDLEEDRSAAEPYRLSA